MRLKTVENEVNKRLDMDLDIRLYGSREGDLCISIWIGSKWSWFSKHVSSLYVTDGLAVDNIVSTIRGYLYFEDYRRKHGT